MNQTPTDLDSQNESRIEGDGISYIVARLEISLQSRALPHNAVNAPTAEDEPITAEDEGDSAPKYNSLAELYDAIQPKTNSDKALVAGYWFQVCQGAESFDGQSVNKELKHLGHGLANITNAIDGLKNQKPALALQLKKSGTSQQARKVYKITVAGIKAVEVMIHG
jgi:hypothetical protein